MAGQKLSAHFSLHEFDCHDGTPVPDHAVEELRRLCRHYLEPLRSAFGPVTVVSGYRTASYNRSVGGAPRSFHVYESARYGAAADVTAARGSPARWHALLERLDPGGLGRYPDHVHVDNRRRPARW